MPFKPILKVKPMSMILTRLTWYQDTYYEGSDEVDAAPATVFQRAYQLL